ncbi:amino acid ABC transporter permease [Paenibacillus sp. FSL M7-1455]|uniref:Cysteine ABC transporter permease n=1 Tax=Paenibacillus cookii TaxID=157839 RepID=A0ABQ4LX97_9BACL|nr:amino acid ABC transporter permease [Paenibacillus cookii]KHF35935.1 L-cystine transport system permease protein TcyM [Paenibacillus sp. P1XP2]GIO67895.1 cysteine ABC transporter permease [Paenibacillus cookii]HWO54424.1 amino acid ABC transporter permease [Paenibacillus cookii]
MKIDPSFIWTAFTQLLPSIPTTLAITAVSVSCGFIIGLIAALLRIYKVPVLGQIASGYVTFIRGTPMLTHLLLIYFGLPMLLGAVSAQFGWKFQPSSIPMIGFAFISFSITAGAYMSEVIRAGLLAVNRGQLEAAYSIGMTTPQALRRIVFPQALGASLPNLSNSVIGMLHGSTLAFAVSVVEINAKAQIVASTNWKFFEAYLAAAVIFWGLTLLIERLTAVIEKRINMYNRGGVA